MSQPITDAYVIERIAAGLWPERYPAGHRLHDPEHEYWVDYEEPQEGTFAEGYQWDAGTIEWVAEYIQIALDRREKEGTV